MQIKMLRSIFFHGLSSPAKVSTIGMYLGCWEHPQACTGDKTSKINIFDAKSSFFQINSPIFRKYSKLHRNWHFFLEGVKISDKNNDKVQSVNFMGKLTDFENFVSALRKILIINFLVIFSGNPVRTFLQSEGSKCVHSQVPPSA